MAIIYSYPLNTPKRDDLLIGTITYDEDAINPVHGNPTVSFTVGSLLDLIASQGAAQNLQQVTNIGNTTTNSIVISNSLKVAGEYYDSSNQPGTTGQLLSSTATGTQWVNVAAQGVTSVGLSMPAAFTVANSPITQTGVLAVTGAGTATQYINGLGNLVTFPTIPTQYVLPVATTVALGGIKIGYTEAGKNYPLELDNEQAYVNVPWTDTIYTLPLATDGARGGVQIGYAENAKNYPVKLSSEKMFVNVPWTDTPYVLPVATSTDLGGVKIGYTTDATARNYAVSLDTEQMLVNVPWTDTQNPFQTITGTGTDNTDSGVLLSNSGGTVKILGDGTVITAAQTGNTITLTGVNTWVANAVTVAGYVAAPAATDANLVWKTDANGNPAWRVDATIPDTGITGVTLATADSTGDPLSEIITNRELTLTSHKYIGGVNVGYVPEGGTSSTYLKGDGTWEAIPTGLIFKGTWDASGGSGGSPDLTLAANKGAGFLWICDVAGTAYPNGGTNQPSTWALGDWCVYDGSAWTRVPATNSGVTSVTTTDGTYIDLTPNTATTGAVTVTADISATVVSGSIDNTKFLRGDNKWAVPAYIPNTDETYDLNAGAKVSTSVPINLTSTSGTDNSLVNLKEGTNVTLTRGSATEITIAAADNNTQNIYTNSWQQSTNDIILRKVLSGAGSGTQDIKIVKGANITFTYTDADNFTIAATDTQENTTWYVRDSADVDKTVNNLKYLKFVTATGALDTALTGAGSTTDPYIMTLTSPDTDTPLSVATSTVLGGIELGSDTALTQTYEAGVTGVANRTYPVQLNSARQAAVSVPWVSGGSYSWTIEDNSTGSSVVDSGESIQFVTATGVLGTALTEPTAGNFVMTLTSPNTTYSNFTAASAVAAGASGLVVAPPVGAQGKFLRGDATWASVPQGDITEIKTTAPITGAATSGIATIAIDNMGAATAAVAGTKGAVPASAAGDQAKFLRADATWVVPTDNNTWNANTKTVPGYVAAPGAVASKVWKTDALGNPGWLDDATGDNNTYSLGSGNTKIITLTDTSTSTAAGTVTFADGNDISISGNNGTITIASTFAEADTLATVTGRGATTTTKSYFNGDLEVNDTITVKRTGSNNGKISIEGNPPLLELKNYDAQTASDQLLSSIEFYGSDTSSTNVAGVRASINCNTGFDDPTGTSNRNQGCLEFATYNGTDAGNAPVQRLKITPDGGFSFGGTSTAYGTAGQLLKSNGDAPPSWINAAVDGVTSVAASTGGDALDVAGTPITSTGTLAFTWAGADTEYIDGEGNLVTFPNIPQGDITGVTAGTDLSGGGTSGTVTLNNISTLATVTGRGATTTTECTFDGDLIVKNEITVNKTNVNTPGKITINGNTEATLQLKSEDVALAANETIGVIEFYGSDGTAPGAGVKSSIRARNGDQTGGSGDKSNLIFAVSDGTSNNNEALRINPTGSIAIDGATNYGSSGQLLQSNGDAPPTWETFNGVTGSGTTNTVPRWSSSSGLSDGPITFFQNAIATWESADANFGGRVVVGGLTNNTVDASIHIGRTNSNNETYILMRTGTGSADYQNWAIGIDASDSRKFKIGDGVNPSGGNTYLEINTSGDLKIYEQLVVGDTSLSATKGQVDIKGISGVISTSLGQANQSHLNLRVTNALNRQGQIVWSSDVNVYTFGLGAIGMVMTAAATGTNTGTADMIFSTKSGAADAASTERMRITSSGSVGIGTGSSAVGKFHVKDGNVHALVVSNTTCGNVGIKTTNPNASLVVKGNISYTYTNYTNVQNTWVSVISMAGYPSGLYQISIMKQTNASSYVTAIIKWDSTAVGNVAGSIVNTIASNQLGVGFNGSTTLQAISGLTTGTAMSANLKCLVKYEAACV